MSKLGRYGGNSLALVKHLGETKTERGALGHREAECADAGATRRADDDKEAKPTGEGKGGQDGDQRATTVAKIALPSDRSRPVPSPWPQSGFAQTNEQRRVRH